MWLPSELHSDVKSLKDSRVLSCCRGNCVSVLQEESQLDWLEDRLLWLLDVQRFVEVPRGPSVGLRDHILQLHCWIHTLQSAPPTVSTPQQLFTISCSRTIHRIGTLS